MGQIICGGACQENNEKFEISVDPMITPRKGQNKSAIDLSMS